MNLRTTLCGPFAAIVFSFPLFAFAEIYRWQDADGKWHYSDKAHGQTDAAPVALPRLNSADPVKVKKAPAISTIEPVSSGAQEAIRHMCETAGDYYDRMTRGIDINAVNRRIVLRKDGETLSRREQNQYAERFRKNYNARGCQIAQAEKLRL